MVDGKLTNQVTAMFENGTSRDKDQFYLALADTVETGADCLGSQVGAVAVRDNRVLGTGYNGTATGFQNCTEGGCGRCMRRDAKAFISGRHYDICLCVHAEQNLMATAARFGFRLEGAALYTTIQPCLQCFKELSQVGFVRVVFIQPWKRDQEELSWVRDNYDALIAQFRDPIGLARSERWNRCRLTIRILRVDERRGSTRRGKPTRQGFRPEEGHGHCGLLT
jgi:dCMP deaminase